jgi:hypothetical protein
MRKHESDRNEIVWPRASIPEQSMANVDEIVNAVLSEGAPFALSDIIWHTIYFLNDRQYLPDPKREEEVRHWTMLCVRQLLESGKAEIGSLSPDETVFLPWQVSVEEAIARINWEWNKLGHEPDSIDLVAVFLPHRSQE